MNHTISPNLADARPAKAGEVWNLAGQDGRRRRDGAEHSASLRFERATPPPRFARRARGSKPRLLWQAGRPPYPKHAILLVALLRHRAGAVVAAMLLLFICPGGPLSAAAPEPPRVEPAGLNDSLDRVLQRREYTWRLPRQAAQADENKGWLTTFFEEAWKKLKRTAQKIKDAYDWFRRMFQRKPMGDGSGSSSGKVDWPTAARWTLAALVAVLAAILGVLLLRWRKARRAGIVTAQPVAAVPDLNEENVTADQLPEDGWLRLAQELVAKGDLRLALRASYLAGLAHLGHRDLIRIARFKSNHDYERELRRRARGNAGLLDAFDENLTSFERSWYGEHDVTPGTLGSFSENLERIRAC